MYESDTHTEREKRDVRIPYTRERSCFADTRAYVDVCVDVCVL